MKLVPIILSILILSACAPHSRELASEKERAAMREIVIKKPIPLTVDWSLNGSWSE